MDRRNALLCLSSLAFLGCETNNKPQYCPTFSTPKTKIIKFGIHPYLNPIDMHSVYQPIMNYLEQNIKNTKFALEASKDYGDFENKLYSGIFDFALPNPYQTIQSFKYDYNVFGKMAPDNDFRGIIVARKDKNLQSVLRLKNQSVSFPAPTALAATMMPLLYLQECGINVKKEIKMYFVGSQYSSILSAYSNTTLAGATWPPPFRAWCKKNPELASQMTVIAQTDPLINNSLVAKNSVPAELIAEVAKLLFGLNQTEFGKKIFSNGDFGGFLESDNKQYAVVNNFLEKFNKYIGNPDILKTLGRQT